ncbi:hypothetical protein NM208_g5143 [Fusarium decemcellulare]|uniref:Uncharacterized protein n=1 Tax=Fusarium decemcellulare TaxID=57161 RepID=A0ACC1SI80_9HYPO|nr:hypothetical protein NM208_g5143 [Fusarium decemcellulare]
MAYAASVNTMNIHGMAYSGENHNTTWPGFAIVQYFTGELVLQAGTIKKDVAFYLYKNPWSASVELEGTDLRNSGYSYEYLGPTNLESDEAVVEDGVLAIGGPAYRALVFDHQKYISPEAAHKVLEFAQCGLPIVIIGNAPNMTIGRSGSSRQKLVSESMSSIATLDNVKFIDDAKLLPKALLTFKVQPRVSVSSETPAPGLWSVWRETEDADLIYLYNVNETATFNLTFEVADDKIPYQLDAWTGEQRAWKTYQRTEAGVSLSLTLTADQTTIFAFAEHCGPKILHATSHSANIEKIWAGEREELIAFVNDSSAATLALSTGRQVDLPAQKGNFSISKLDQLVWNLTLQSWVPSDDSSVTRSVVKTIELGPQSSLRPWSAIGGMQNVSGVGVYTTTFSLPKNFELDQSAVLVHFGPILGTLRVWVNERLVPPLDVSNAEAYVTELLVLGENRIKVEVSSNLFNAVKARIDSIYTGGDPVSPQFRAQYTGADWQAYGLVGPVTTRVLRKVVIEP